MGPQKQLKNMMHPSRYIATIIYVISMILTLYCALKLKRMGPTLVCVMIQVNFFFFSFFEKLIKFLNLIVFYIKIKTAALIWYGASYIPFAQRCIRKTTGVLIA